MLPGAGFAFLFNLCLPVFKGATVTGQKLPVAHVPDKRKKWLLCAIRNFGLIVFSFANNFMRESCDRFLQRYENHVVFNLTLFGRKIAEIPGVIGKGRTMIGTDGKLVFILAAFASLFISCGSSSNSVPETISPSANSASIDIGPDGGTIELPGTAVVEFPAGAFSSQVKVTMELVKVDENLKARYEMAASFLTSGPAYEKALIISSSVQPLVDAEIEFTLPEEFLRQIDPDNQPALFGKYLQYGADDEEIEDFESLQDTLSGNTLTATLPVWFFTNKSSPDNTDQAIVMLASVPSGSTSLKNTDSFFLTSTTSSNVCGGNLIGNPLEELIVTSPFGPRKHPISLKKRMHSGIDLQAATGTPVLAVADGTVRLIGFDFNSATQTGYGRYVELLHKDGSKTRYAHLEEDSVKHLKIGDSVSIGMMIGKADTTGGAKGPHLHFEYKPPSPTGKNIYIDPYSCLISPITIGTATFGKALYWWDFVIPFKIGINVPENNNVQSVNCKVSGTPSDLGYDCHASYDGSDSISGEINLLKARGVASAIVQITDLIGRQTDLPVSSPWDCCDSGDTAYYMGVIRSCIALNDDLENTKCPVK